MYNKKILFAAWAANNKNYASYQSWHGPLKNLFKYFISFDPQEELSKLSKQEMNEKFLSLISKEQPDYILFWLIHDEFPIETFVKIREVSPKTKLINFFGDDDILYDNFSKYYADFFDYGLVFQDSYIKKYEKDRILKVYKAAGATTSAFFPQKVEKKYDISFIGTPKQDRYEIVKHLYEQGFNVRVFGEGWKNYPDLHKIFGGSLSQEEMTKTINATKINLSFSKNYLGKAHIKGRVFEIMACNSFLLSEYFEGSNKFFKKDEIVTFKDKKDLVKKIKYYLSNEKEREAIAERAYKRVVKDYNQDLQVKRNFQEIINDKSLAKKIKLVNYSNKIIYLDSKLISLDKAKLIELLKKYEYVGFIKQSMPLKYKDSIQVRSLESTGKPISCCDYYVYSKGLGDYLALYGKYSYFYLGKKDFNSVITPAQLMIRKEYFLANLLTFRKIMAGEKTNLVDEANTAFVTIPLVRIKKFNQLNEMKKNRAFLFSFDSQINRLIKKGKIIRDPYIYRLVMISFLRKDFIWRYIVSKIFTRLNFIRRVGKI